VTFLVRFKVDGGCDAAPVRGGGGGKLGGVTICLKRKNATMVSQRDKGWCTYLYGVSKSTKNGSKSAKMVT